MRGRQLVLAGTVLVVVLLGADAESGQPDDVHASLRVSRLPSVSHRIPGKQYARTNSATVANTRLRHSSPSQGQIPRLPAIAYLFQPMNQDVLDPSSVQPQSSDGSSTKDIESGSESRLEKEAQSFFERPDEDDLLSGGAQSNADSSSVIENAPTNRRNESDLPVVQPTQRDPLDSRLPEDLLLIDDDDVLPGYEHLGTPVRSSGDHVDADAAETSSQSVASGDESLPTSMSTDRDTFNESSPTNETDLKHKEVGELDDAVAKERERQLKGIGSQLDPHLELLSKNMYPSAKECGKCHEDHYREWSVSAHAYATISPMFHKFEQKINDLSKGTIGYFCMRCHAPVATSICESRDEPLWESIPAANEGVTCIACHRVIERYFKVNGERRIETGSIFEPVVGSSNQNKLHEIIARKDHYKVKTSPDDKGTGQAIHNEVICFEQLSSSHFCVSCHQVAVHPGIKLEIVWDQYRASPACKQGISCQDCHMGAVPGKAEGYATGPTAVVGGKKVSPHRKHANHMFYGPGYSIAHPGTFPINPKAEDWNVKEWLQFDWRAGWGTEEFEDLLDEGKIDVKFPKVWQEADDRMDARDVINENLHLLAEKRYSRFELMENSSKIEGPYFTHAPKTGKPLKFKYRVQNLNSGHNMPSGSLGAQPQVWLNVVLTGPLGNRLWESGYVDANGDVADLHSLEVAAGRIRRDQQLFNLQTRFLTTGVKGTDREMYLPINVDIDQLPFIRPSGLPVTNLNHPPFIRLENHSLAPLGERDAKYRVPANCMETPGRYRLSVRMRSRAEPIYFMRFCNATPEMERGMNERMLDFHQHAYEFVVR